MLLMFSLPGRAVTTGGGRVAGLIEQLTRPDFAHVAPCSNGAVLEVQFDGVRLCDRDSYMAKYPTLAWAFVIEAEHVDLTPLASRVPCVHQSLAWYESGGTSPAFNCVTATKDALLLAGVRAPKWAMTPDHLFDWCRERGYEQYELGPLDEVDA